MIANMVQEFCGMKCVRIELNKEDHEHTFGRMDSTNKW